MDRISLGVLDKSVDEMASVISIVAVFRPNAVEHAILIPFDPSFPWTLLFTICQDTAPSRLFGPRKESIVCTEQYGCLIYLQVKRIASGPASRFCPVRGRNGSGREISNSRERRLTPRVLSSLVNRMSGSS